MNPEALRLVVRCSRCGESYLVTAESALYHAVLGCVSETEEHLLMASLKRGSRRGATA